MREIRKKSIQVHKTCGEFRADPDPAPLGWINIPAISVKGE